MICLGSTLIILMGKVKGLERGMRNSQKDVGKNLKSKVVCKGVFLTIFKYLNLVSCFIELNKMEKSGSLLSFHSNSSLNTL